MLGLVLWISLIGSAPLALDLLLRGGSLLVQNASRRGRAASQPRRDSPHILPRAAYATSKDRGAEAAAKA